MERAELNDAELDRIVAAAVVARLRISSCELSTDEIIELCGNIKRFIDEVRRLRA